MATRIPLVAAATVLALAGCATHVAVVKIGDDTYRTSVEAGGTSPARERALANASRKCAALGRDVEILEVRGGYPETAGAVTVTFRCSARIHR